LSGCYVTEDEHGELITVDADTVTEWVIDYTLPDGVIWSVTVLAPDRVAAEIHLKAIATTGVVAGVKPASLRPRSQ